MNGYKPKVLLYNQISDESTPFFEKNNISVTPRTFNETTQTTAVAGGSDSGSGLGGGGAVS